MKKYKLIQWYPSLPKGINEGLIISTLKQNDLYPIFCDKGSLLGIIDKKEVENYPDFWQEIIEKDYEILSFRVKSQPMSILTKRDNGRFTALHSVYEGKYTEEDILSGDPERVNWGDSGIEYGYEIHSVKRLSDGEIFTIGDSVELNNQNHFPKTENILAIRVIDDKIRFKMNFQLHHNWDSSYTLDFINKLKQPLFTTEDGVDIFEDKEGYFKYWILYTDKYILESDRWKIPIAPNICKNVIPTHTEEFDELGIKRFSTKEALEGYVMMNEPKFSINDFLMYFDRSQPIVLIEKLKELYLKKKESLK